MTLLVRRIFDLRIVKWYYKLLFVVGAWCAGFPVEAVIDAVGAPETLGMLANWIVTIAAVLFCARLFRGRDEPVAPRRPWWKMTARRPMSRALGILSLVGVVSSASEIVMLLLGLRQQSAPDAGILALSLSVYAVLAFLYFNSAARLPKTPPRPRPATRAREPKFRATVRLK